MPLCLCAFAPLNLSSYECVMEQEESGFMPYYLYLIAEKRKKEQEKAQKLREKLLSDIGEALSELSQSAPFQDAYIFGSITTPQTFSPDSDVDIAFYGLKDEDFFKAIAFLSRRLAKDVDVVQLEGHRLEGKIKKHGDKMEEMRWRRNEMEGITWRG